LVNTPVGAGADISDVIYRTTQWVSMSLGRGFGRYALYDGVRTYKNDHGRSARRALVHSSNDRRWRRWLRTAAAPNHSIGRLEQGLSVEEACQRPWRWPGVVQESPRRTEAIVGRPRALRRCSASGVSLSLPFDVGDRVHRARPGLGPRAAL
jgi:hypothetical protein